MTTRGIVVAKEHYGEADLKLVFLTRDHGLLSVWAKFARKSKRRFAGGVDLFCHDEINVAKGKGTMPYLNELSVLNTFLGLRDQLDRVLAAGVLARWVLALAAPNTPTPALYSILGQTLALLEKENVPERMELLVLVFKLKLLSILGLKPHLDSCVRCEAPEGPFVFDVASGGAICAACAPRGLPSDAWLTFEQQSFLSQGDRIKFASLGSGSLWAATPALNRSLTQFASFHTHLRLPI